jgi:hypothetical protein
MRLGGTFNHVTNAYCDGTIIYIDPVEMLKLLNKQQLPQG